MSGVQNFEKRKIQVQYSVDDTSGLKTGDISKDYKDDADKLIKTLKETKDWGFDFDLDAKKPLLTRIKSTSFPQLQNGHVGEHGHSWQWQLDVKSLGAGSKVRLYVDSFKADIKTQKVETKTKTVGREEYTVITVGVKLSGTFTADQKH